jgi:hypothetical protein
LHLIAVWPFLRQHQRPTLGYFYQGLLNGVLARHPRPGNRHEQVTDETAREKFVQALYEIQRGYNFKGTHDNLEDDGDPRDLVICNAGAFKKITNVMSEILVTRKLFTPLNTSSNSRLIRSSRT